MKDFPSKMATVRQADTALWLHNKLSSEDPWSGSSLRSLLTQDVLKNIPECFHRLEPQVKVKLLMAFLHLPSRVVEETSSELTEILEMGCHDEDEWVRVLSEILKFYPSTGMLNVHLEAACPVFAEVTQDLRNALAQAENGPPLLPLECPYLNRTALHSLVGPQPAPPKHFTLKRKPKSAALRAELMQKASEALAAQRKAAVSAGGNTLGSAHKTHSKKFTEPPSRVSARHTPMHIPSPRGAAGTAGTHGTSRSTSTHSSASRTIISAATLKQHGRTKLLDINEQPIGGGREVKRRKKMTEMEQADEAKQKKLETQKLVEAATPEYAAGLTALATPTTAGTEGGTSTTTSSTVSTSAPTPSYAVPSSASRVGVLQPAAPTSTPTTSQTPTINLADPSLSESTMNLKRELEMHMEQQRQLMMRERQQKRAAAAAAAASAQLPESNPRVQSGGSISTQRAQSGGSISTPSQGSAPSQAASSVSGSSASPSGSEPATNTAQMLQNKRQLTLSREQMIAAHEMFRNANRVSRAEKALILGFMAGARDKPLSHQGSVITIKLSENTETVPGTDGTQQTLLVEMLFEMNYDTGHWRRLKRTRVLSKQQAGNRE